MYRYTVENKFGKSIGTFNTTRDAVDFIINTINDELVNCECGLRRDELLKEKVNFCDIRKSLGTKFSPKPTKFIFGKFYNILVRII